MWAHTDDLGARLTRDAAPQRVVSLVPSLTESVASAARELLVGVTDWCSHPGDLDLPRVGGTKWPSLDAVRSLEPDLVPANAEENRAQDIEALRATGIDVWVTVPRTLAAAWISLRRMFAVLGVVEPAWLGAAEQVWQAPAPPARTTAVIPVWRRPWVVLGGDTFAGDVLAHLGVTNVYANSPQRYPRPSLAELLAARPELVVLPDEPYAFSATDGPECFAGLRCALVSGRALTWYGPSLLTARALLEAQLRG